MSRHRGNGDDDDGRSMAGNASTAQLNSWTETMKKQKPSGRRPPHPQRERGEAHYDEHDRNLNTYSSTAQLNQWTESQRNKQKKSGASSLESSDNEGGRIDGKMSESSSVERLNNWTSSVRAGGKGDKRLGGGEVGIEYDDEFAHQAREMRSDSSTERLQEWTSSMKVPGKGNIGGGELGVEYDDEFAVQARQMRSNSSLERLQEWTSEQQQAKAGGGQQRVIEPEEYEMMNREMRSNSSTERFETWTSSQKKEKEHREAKQQQRGRGGDEGEEEEEEEAGGDYDDDGFEDYDDEDFEDDEEESPSKAPPKQQQGAGGASNASGSKAAAKQAQLQQQQQAAASASNAAAADSKHKSSSQQPTSRGAKGSSSGASSRPKKFENMQISFSPSTMTDPRGVRVKRLLDSGVMELQLERATHWQVLPITPYELYLNKLRLNPSNVRQVGVPSDLERRDVDSNTDIIETQDCSVQFSYGDDTAFYEVLAEITRRRGHNSKSKTSTGSGADAKGEGGATGMDVSLQDIARGKSTAAAAAGDEGNPGAVSTPAATTLAAAASSADNSSGATRLTTFLQRASLLCEAVLQDQDDRAMLDQQQQNNGDDDSRHGDAKSTTRGGGVSSSSSLPVLDTQSDWVTLGQDMSRGGNETVRTRRIAAVRFSPLQPHLILSAHPFPTLDRDGADAVEMDLKPYKGLYCVWDVANPGGPAFVLEGTGQPVCCCFSATQPHLLLGATQEGTLHLWDLREHAAIHKDRDAVDLQIDKGIRKPCYSTNLSFPAVEGDGSDGRYGVGSGAYHGGAVEDDPSGAGWQHSSPVVQVESLTLGGGRGGGGGGAGAVGGGAATGAAAVSQFVSIDEAGLMIFWITSQQKQQQSQLLGGNGAAGGGGEDLQRSPWAGVMLVQTRQIHTHSHSLYHPIGVGVHQAATTTHGPRGAAAAGGGGGGGFIGAGGGAVLQGTVVLAPIPDDLSTLLVSGGAGEVARVSRFSSSSSSSHPTSNNDNNNGNSNTKQQQLAQYATTPQLLRRVRVSSGLDVSMITSQDADAKGISNSSINSNAGHPQELSLFSAVSCMSVRENVYIPNSNSNSSVEGGSSDAEGGSSAAAATTTQHQQAEAEADAKEDSAGGNRTSNRSGSAASSNSSSRASLILVGRFDGTLDLFQVDVEHPIQSWNLNEFMKATNGTGIGRAGSSAATGMTSASRVVMVQWCSSRAGVFFAANKAGCLFHFNLLQNMAAPVHVAPLEVAHKLRSRHSIDVSRVRPGTGAFYVTVMSSSSHSSSSGGGGGGDDSGDVLYARRGSARLAKCMPNQLIQEEVQLRASLHQLSAKRCETPSVMYLPPSKHYTPLVNDSKS